MCQNNQIHGAAAVFGWMADEVAARNPASDKPIVSIMDGQDSLWNMRDVFQGRRSDGRHFGSLARDASAVEGRSSVPAAGSSKAEKFVRERVVRVRRGEVSVVIVGLRRFGHDPQAERQETHKTRDDHQLLHQHRDRMRYHEYLSAGYPIASGVIERACRHVVKDRLERTGMTWTLAGAQAMLALRCIHLSDDWDNFNKFRVQRETRRLYPYRDTLNETSWAIAT